MKIAAKSGNVGLFNAAKEVVMFRGKVNTRSTRANIDGCR